MRALSRHEKKLTLFLVVAVGLGIHLIALRILLSFDQGNRRALAGVLDSLSEAEGWLGQKAEWETKGAWLEKYFLAVPEANPAPALQKSAQAAALAAGLKIEEQSLRQPKTGFACTVYGNRMKLAGNLDSFIQWLLQVYQPEKGIAVASLTLKMSPEAPKMTGEAEVCQFFKSNKP